MIEKISPFVKTTVKFLGNAAERKRVFSEVKTRKQQDEGVFRYNSHTKKLIVFLVPGADPGTGKDKITGGIMSIVSICEESEGMKDIHGAEVIMCTFKNEYLLFRHAQFVNHTDVFRFSQLQRYFTELEEVIIHIPEFTCQHFLDTLDKTNRSWLAQLKKVHINILNQNIRLMPSAGTLELLKKTASTVSATTAHQRYCNQHYRQEYDMPLHKFSVWISPEKYTFKKFSEKEDLIVVSPDGKPIKATVLEKLAALPGLRIQIIQNLTYEQYKETISRAKWALTFGEGLDGYIIEPIFSGAIGFAVYNEEFFTPDFKNIATIYGSYEELLKKIVSDIRRLDKEEAYEAYQREQFELCARYYSQDQYRKNIEAFYKGQYSFP